MMRIANKFKIGVNLFVLILFLHLVNPAQAAGSARLIFLPTSATATVGSQFDVQIIAKPMTESLDTVRAVVSFPTAKLEATAFAYGTVYNKPSPISCINNTLGQISQGAAILNGSTTNDAVFGTITFKALAAGQATLTFDNTSKLIRSGEEKIDLANLGNATITITTVVTPTVYQCNDGLDNDGDGKIDLADPGCSNNADNDETDAPPPVLKQCSDGLDNDGDGKIDLADPGCSNALDNNEADIIIQPPGIPPGTTIFQCNDGIDNDGDGKTDLSDPGCANAADNDETDILIPPAVFQCNDNIDNDGDGKIDLADPGCSNALDNNEADIIIQPPGMPPGTTIFQCNDEIDNDGDGKIDLADTGCVDATDNDETNLFTSQFQCNDGVDNDGDGKIDYPNDPGCANAADNNEIDSVIGTTATPGTAGANIFQCNDEIDNDNDGKIDLADPGCDNPTDNDEMEFVAKPLVQDIIAGVASIISQITHQDVSIIKERVEKTVQTAVKTARVAQKATIDNPMVEKTNENFAAPAVAAVAVVNVSTAISFASFFSYLRMVLQYLQLLIFQPLLLLGRRKRKGWGVVYNSLTKLPIDLALVRLIDQTTGRLLQTRVTDRQGRFTFIVGKPGIYRLEVVKPDFTFPSQYLADKKTDLEWLDLYHGEILEIKNKGEIITRNIPIDPLEKVALPANIIKIRRRQRLQNGFALTGFFFGLVSLTISPNKFIFTLLVLHLILFVLFKRLAVGRKPKSWGTVYEYEAKNPLEYVIARIFETDYNKLLETQVTDSHGRYTFLVGKNKYYLTFEKTGFQPHQTEHLDLTLPEKEKIIGLDIKLKKAGEATPTEATSTTDRSQTSI